MEEVKEEKKVEEKQKLGFVKIENELVRKKVEKAKFKISQSDLRDFTKTIGDFTDECRFNLNKYGIEVREVDPAHVALLQVKLPISKFREFELPEDEVEFTIDLPKFESVRKRFSSAMAVEYDNGALLLDGEGKRYQMDTLMDADRVLPKLPNFEFEADMVIHEDFLSDVVKDCFFTEVVSFYYEDGKLKVIGKGNTLRYEKIVDVKGSGKKCHAHYSLEYLSKIAGAKRLVERDEVVMKLANDAPLYISIGKNVEMYLAPRIVEEDEPIEEESEEPTEVVSA